jgi:hypothetical protein
MKTSKLVYVQQAMQSVGVSSFLTDWVHLPGPRQRQWQDIPKSSRMILGNDA